MGYRRVRLVDVVGRRAPARKPVAELREDRVQADFLRGRRCGRHAEDEDVRSDEAHAELIASRIRARTDRDLDPGPFRVRRVGSAGLGGNFDRHGRDIICHVQRQSRGDQGLRWRDAVVFAQHIRDLPEGNGFAQTVAAQQKFVALLHAPADLVENQFLDIGANGAGNDIRMRVLFRVFLSNRAVIDQFLNQTVIFGDLAHFAVAQQIGARVARPKAGEMFATRQKRDQCGSDDCIVAAPFGFHAQRLMGFRYAGANGAEQFRGRDLVAGAEVTDLLLDLRLMLLAADLSASTPVAT